ncbi:CBS domain-containing protein [Ensifer sp. ENS09]|uniref:CBS domain-containing protein n=1 Tax=Ensifer sp. ENS09 TaxID=2769263 RepID=UPI00178181CC|nr:CBS domain-containing protein [Ensifer sp. ENS09]MBD9650359.1 CBS domain-containing protein [Ensifer sp. ENS09]
MRIADIMRKDVHVARPDDTVSTIAREMAKNDIGFPPVGNNDRLVGMITDRDIVVCCVGERRDDHTRLSDIMTADVNYCFEDEDVSEFAHNIGNEQVRRLPVLDRNKGLVGLVSLADAARRDPSLAGIGLQDVTNPGGPHIQRP